MWGCLNSRNFPVQYMCSPLNVHFSLVCFSIFSQSAQMNAWPGSQQVLVGPFQQIPGLTAATAASTQRPVTQQILPENLAHQHMLSDNWRQSFVLDGFDQASLAQLVSVVNNRDFENIEIKI